MEASLLSYIPQDRCRALAHGRALPERLAGAALFADISGFTPLTEALARSLGPRRGAEALTTSLNAVYDALIAAVERYAGSVLTFSGDAITCWFDDLPGLPGAASGALRAATCALALQQAMRPFAALPIPGGGSAPLALKVAIARGPARRFVVGDPAIQLIDALAGPTIDRVAEAEHQAARGEIILDEATAAALGGGATIAGWRADAAGARYAALADLRDPAAPCPWPALADADLGEARIRPWLLPAVYAREQTGLGEFLTEFRPAAALFARFLGIDYTQDDAGAHLDAFVRAAQHTIARYEGVLLQLTIGDKGAYLYAAFGAPVAHEDDRQRAARAALGLRSRAAALGTLQPIQIGLSCGTLRTGAYGGSTRRTYGVIGDDVNLAARLMQLAAPGEIILSDQLQAPIAAEFALEPRAPVLLKGKSAPQLVFTLAEARRRRAGRLRPPAYALPMVGRAAELARIAACLEQALAGRGQRVGVSGAAGMGKSRLVAEAIRLADGRGLAGYGGSCRADGTTTPYLVWGAIWQALFQIDPEAPAQEQIGAVARQLQLWAPARAEALPLLGPLLGLPIPESTFTQALEPLDRKNTLHALLGDCLAAAVRAAAAGGAGLLLVLEDVHWIDAASHELLAELGDVVAGLPVLLILAHRPIEAPAAPLAALTTAIALTELSAAEAAEIIDARLAQLFPARAAAPPAALIERLTGRAQGNPFYLEELINYLHDHGVDPHDPAALVSLELPSSLHSLILSRIDQLGAHQQLALKVASVLGRRFGFANLCAIYPGAARPIELRDDLDRLAALDLTSLDAPDPELAYLFKHIVTQEVAYESLAYATRAALHEQVGAHLERIVGDADQTVDLLAYHYERSANLPKKRYYLRRAGERAAARYANIAALAYLSRALELAPEADGEERYALLRTREQLHALQAQRAEQRQDLAALAALAATLGDEVRRAEVAVREANYAYRGGQYAEAIAAAAWAAAIAVAAGAAALEVSASQEWAWALIGQGEYGAAQARAAACLRRAEQIGDQRAACRALQALGEIAGYQGDLKTELAYYQRAIVVANGAGDRRAEGLILNNMSVVATDQGDYAAGRWFAEQSLEIARTIGNRRSEGFALGNLGNASLIQGDYAAARAHLAACLQIMHATGNRLGEAMTFGNLSTAEHLSGDDAMAEQHARAAIAIATAIGDQGTLATDQVKLGDALLGQGRTAAAGEAYQAALDLRRALSQPHLAAEAQAGLARVALAQGDLPGALEHVAPILAFLEGGGALDGAEHPLLIMLTCYEALHAAGDPRAPGVLAGARAALADRAAQIPDPAARRTFLEAIPHHRTLMAIPHGGPAG